MKDKHYAVALRRLQIELVKQQRHFIGCGDCTLVIAEGRDGVERVMGFCTKKEYEQFITSATGFEHMLVHSGIKLFKCCLDISRKEQKKRLNERQCNPLKQRKASSIDAQALKHRKDFRHAHNEMFARTQRPIAPWTVVRADNKPVARLGLLRDLLRRIHYDGKDEKQVLPDPAVLFNYDGKYLKNGTISK